MANANYNELGGELAAARKRLNAVRAEKEATMARGLGMKGNWRRYRELAAEERALCEKCHALATSRDQLLDAPAWG